MSRQFSFLTGPADCRAGVVSASSRPVLRAIGACLLVGLIAPEMLRAQSAGRPATESPAGRPVQTGGTSPAAEYIRRLIPERIEGMYPGGRLVPLRIAGRNAYVIEPTGVIDRQRRWIWIFPFWLGINDGHGQLHHHWYVERFLRKGFHIAGIDVGTSCGSPAGARVCGEFYDEVHRRFRLDDRARLVVQSNGGLIGYSWAIRQPERVERIGGICPATDFWTWPGIENVTHFPEPGLGYGLTAAELVRTSSDYNPIDRLEPLARHGVRILHIHGDRDELVPMGANSTELARRYRHLAGRAEIVALPGLGHGGLPLYESQTLVDFLLGD
jgi:pimeloyl-ACP methyl ester carboxylesterase